MTKRLASISASYFPSYFLYLAFFCLLLSSSAAAQYISRVEVQGLQKVARSAVLSGISTKPGTQLSKEKLSKDIKSLYRAGYFERVEAFIDGSTLIFAVTERPAIRKIKFEGLDEFSSSKAKETLNLEDQRFLNARKLAVGIEKLKQLYQEEGFYSTEIRYESVPVETEAGEENKIDLSFDIEEGEKQRLRKIIIEGNTAFDDDELKDVLASGTYRWWSSWISGTGLVKEESLSRDVAALTQHYLNNGYVDAKVTKPEIETIDEGLQLRYQIAEGQQFDFGTVRASGDLLPRGEKATLSGIESESGDTFNLGALREDSFTISNKFTNIGYAFVNVEPRTRINRKTKKVDVNFAIDRGKLVHIDEIRISGNEKTRDNVIRRTLNLTEGEVFSSSKVERSEQLLKRLGYFEEVSLTPTKSRSDNQVNLDVAVKEGSTGQFSAGAGLSSIDGFIVTGRITETNLFGSGNTLSLDLNTGTVRENYVLSFSNPRISDSRWSGSVNALLVSREFDDFSRSQAGGSIRFGYPLWFLGAESLDDVRFSMGYELLQVKIDDVDNGAAQLIQDEEGSSVLSSVSPRLTRNTIDNPLYPSEGSRQALEFELAGLGGDEKFWLAEANNTLYYPLWNSPFGAFIFSNRARLAWGETFDDDRFPLIRRFFPGGINSVRGFDAFELGTDTNRNQ